MKKRLLVCVLSCLMLLSLALPAASSPNEITIVLDGELLKCEQPPVIKNDRTFVPVRAVAEGFGAKVDWNAEKRMIQIAAEDQDICFYLDHSIYT